jgi:hypothetical protein
MDHPESREGEGAQSYTVVHVEVLRVGLKVAISGGTIYEQPRPPGT